MKFLLDFYEKNLKSFKTGTPSFNTYIEDVCTDTVKPLSSTIGNNDFKNDKKERSYTFSNPTTNYFSNNEKQSNYESNGNYKFNLPKNNPLQNMKNFK
jgi:hypothetical protein